MVELAGLILGIVGVLFAFETPRRRVVGIFSPRAVAKDESSGLTIPVIDICHRGISVKEIEPNKLHFDIPYCAGKNANAHNVKLQTAILLKDGSGLKKLSSFGDDFPEGISLTYETGKSISYTLSPLTATALSSLYIVVRGTYTAEVGERVFPVFDVFKFSVPTKSWVRTLGDEDKSVRAFARAEA
jgi:hypothetical protein